MDSGIYEIVNVVNGKRYIGSTKNFAQRWKAHRVRLKSGTHGTPPLQFSWNKYGADAFIFRKLLLCDEHNLLFYEQRAVDALDPEFNIVRDVARPSNTIWVGRRHRPETIAKMSAVKLGKPSAMKGKTRRPDAVERTAAAHRGMKRSNETRAKISAKAHGRKCPPRSTEHRARLSAALRGRHVSPESIEKMRATKLAAGHRHTDEWKAAASLRLRGCKRPKSPEHRAKIAASLRGRKATPEARANQAAAQKGKPWSAARRAAEQNKHCNPKTL